jgi:hypothetical protein
MIGSLLLAFTPLDAVLWSDAGRSLRVALTFIVIGVSFFALATVSEQRRHDA